MGKKLLFDIEVSLGKYWAYRCGYNINILPHQIIEEPKIICIAYKYEGEKKSYCLDWGKKRCDKAMLKKFVRIAEGAEVIIGHNSDKFDVKYIRTRCYFHNLPMMPEFTSLDTYKEAKKGFSFQSNGLDYISKYGGGKGKQKTEFQLWTEATNGSLSALNDMKKYCVADVLELEGVYERMKKYMKPKTSAAHYKGDCPNCGSENMRPRNYGTTRLGTKFCTYQCRDCGQYHKVNDNAVKSGQREKAKDAAKNKR